MDVVANLERIRNRIADAGGDNKAIRIVAVTKGHGVAAVRGALAAGVREIGENYAQELTEKAALLGDDVLPRWHFIGQLQRNKVRSIAHLVELWQTVDRLRVGEEIARRVPNASVLVQVNLTDDPERGGQRPSLVPGLVDGLRDLGLTVEGLMAVAPNAGPVVARDGFRRVRELADRLGLHERSMGMSGDFDVAIEEGATMVRLGSALFGARHRPRFP